jgi:two-component system response regulator ResD
MSEVVLLIEDDRRIRELLPRYFVRAGMMMLTAPDGQTGLSLLAERHPDLVLLDVNLPDLDGWSIVKRIRHGLAPQQPVIMLTGRSDVPDRLMGLDLGADDYIVKPFEPLEVVARVRAVLRRTARAVPAEDVLDFPGLRIDLAGRAVFRGTDPVGLSAREFDLLVALATHPGRVLTRNQLCDIGWGDDALGDDHTLDVTMNRLRRKLTQEDDRGYLTTIRGVGYKFEMRHGA